MSANLSKESIVSASQKFVAAWNRGDLKGACQIYAVSASFLTSKGLVLGREAIGEFYEESYPNRSGMGVLSLDMVEHRAIYGDKMVSAVFEWVLKAADGTSISGLSLETWVLEEGQPRILQDSSTAYAS